MDEEKVKTNTGYRELLGRLWPFFKSEKGLLISVFVAVFALAGVSRLLPFLIGKAIEEGFKGGRASVVYQIALIYLAVELMKMFLSFLHKYLFQVLGAKVLGNLRRSLHQHVMSLPVDYFHRNPAGRTVTRMTNDVSVLSEVFSDGVINLFTQSVMIIAILSAMVIVSFKLTLLTLLSTPLFIFLTYYLSQKVKVILREQKKKLSEMNSFFAEHLNGIKISQLYNQNDNHLKKFNSISTSYRDLNMQSIKTYALMQPSLNLLNAGVVCSALFWAGGEALSGHLAIGLVVAFILNGQDLIQPIREIIDRFQMFQNSLTSAERIFNLMDEVPEDDLLDPSKLNNIYKIEGHIKVQGLSFKYQPHLPLALDHIHFEIPKGTSLALVGRTGSGKTTVISLLQRFYDPLNDSIFIDGISIQKIPRHFLRKQIGVIQQDPFVFKGTLLDNITMNDPHISESLVTDMAQEIGFVEYLKGTGRDFNFLILEKGSNLSLGERQVIAFLRMMVRDPKILILDEATANIDSMTEALIQKATRKILQGRTSIVIAHRLSTVQACNCIAVMSRGKIEEMGSAQELLKQDGIYSQLAEEGAR